MKRNPGLGVRAKTITGDTTSEFVIRESADGNETLSLLHIDDLIQVVTSKRDQFGNIKIEKHMIAKNVETFSHYRYDWLDTTKFVWWTTLTLGILFLIIGAISGWGINLGAALFTVGLLFTLLQAADPEYIVFETTSGSHRFLVYRIRSNLELTNMSMDLIDEAMQNYLQTGKLDTSALDSEAQRIENQRVMMPSSYPPTSAPSGPPTPAPTTPPPADPPTPAPTTPPPVDPPTPAPAGPPPMLPPTTAPSGPPPMLPPTTAPAGPPPMLPPTTAPSGPPPMLPPTTVPSGPPSDFSNIPAPPPVDFSDIPSPPEIDQLETVSEEDKNELLDVLK